MKISVIIPVFNSSKTLDKCLSSILKQTYKNLEIIVVNDGSSDDSKVIIDSYAEVDDRIIPFHNSNHGVSFSRNFGISKATGDYITFVDSDDFLEDDCYMSLLKFMDNDFDVIRYNYIPSGGNAFNNNLGSIKNKLIDLKSDDLHVVLKKFLLSSKESLPNLTMLLLINKRIINQVKFDENLTMMEDVDFYLQLFLSAQNIYFADSKKYYYCINPNSVTNNPNYYKKNILGIIDSNKSIVSKFDKSKNDFIKKINYNHIRIISEYLLKMYLYSFNDFVEFYNDLFKNEHFIYMLNNSKGYSKLKNKLIIIIMKHFGINFLLFYFRILSIIYKLKK